MNMSIRNSKLLEKTNYLKFNFNTPITLPANGAHQTKTGYRFTVSDRKTGMIGTMHIFISTILLKQLQMEQLPLEKLNGQLQR